ncbi:MAG: transposase [Actinomycetota bacterium]
MLCGCLHKIHKRRNVLEHLPKHLRATVGKQLDKAWRDQDAKRAQRSIETLAANLEADHPGAAGSIREGLAETLTVNRLGLPDSLRRSLRSTNAVESMISITREVTRNVKRWRDGTMVCRWTAAGMVVAQRQFRRVNGYRDMHVLIAALKQHAQGMSVQEAMLQESA